MSLTSIYQALILFVNIGVHRKGSMTSKRHFVSNTPPKRTARFQMADTDVFKPVLFDDELLVCLAQLRDPRHTGVCGLIRIRIARLEKRSEGPCVAFVDHMV